VVDAEEDSRELGLLGRYSPDRTQMAVGALGALVYFMLGTVEVMNGQTPWLVIW
jgi:hypothetical protein